MKREHEQNQKHPPAGVCNECKKAATSEERWLLHTVRHKTSYRRLCTHCVLNCFRGSFCPICLNVFDPIDSPPRPTERVMCLNCPSISHLDCSTATSNSGSHPFQCPPCSNPNFSFFKLKQINSHKKLKLDCGDAAANQQSSTKGDVEYSRRAIDNDSAKALVAAAKIASATLTKAAKTARDDADRRVREAALARKKAKEALERVASLSLKQKERDFKGGANGLGIMQEQKMRPRINHSTVMEGQNEGSGEVKKKPEKGSNGISKNHPNNIHHHA